MDYAVIDNALPANLLQEIRQAINAGPFDSGKDTAQGLAKALKNNLQISQLVHGDLLDRIGHAIKTHQLVHVYALPHHVSRPIINRYEAGMEYGMHVDQAYISEIRTDLSYTLFLDDPASYEGGELVIASLPQQIAFKLPAGSIVIYPTNKLHRVAQITHGTRHAVVGWIQSRVRDADQRNLITQLSAVKNTLAQQDGHTALALQTNECIQQLIRMWGD